VLHPLQANPEPCGQSARNRCWASDVEVRVMHRNRAALVFPLLIATSLAGCTSSPSGSSQRPQRIPVGTTPPKAKSVEPPPNTQGPEGTVRGIDDECAGLAKEKPHKATVRVLLRGQVVAAERVVAGDPARDRYSMQIAPGRYQVEATNWPSRHQTLVVRKNAAATADFLNDCS
jgi:hypothetical protein